MEIVESITGWPPGYEYGGTLNNPDQMCHNCKYFVRDYCAAWDADVRKEFWCKKWQEEEVLEKNPEENLIRKCGFRQNNQMAMRATPAIGPPRE